MTQQELRELDAWIAEKVMGWKPFVSGKTSSIKGTFWLDSEHKVVASPEFQWTRFDPTTDRAAAMQVLEKCADRVGVRIDRYNGRAPNVWYIRATDGRLAEAEAPTLPIAICLFAKKLFS